MLRSWAPIAIVLWIVVATVAVSAATSPVTKTRTAALRTPAAKATEEPSAADPSTEKPTEVPLTSTSDSPKRTNSPFPSESIATDTAKLEKNLKQSFLYQWRKEQNSSPGSKYLAHLGCPTEGGECTPIFSS